MGFNDAEYEPRPAAACAAGTCPGSDRSADAGKQDRDQVREDFIKHRLTFSGHPNATLVRTLEVLEEEKLTQKNAHPHRSVKTKVGRVLKWEQCCVGESFGELLRARCGFPLSGACW
ncbi:hypothetical protein MRX96_031014 [Rhipicephalus microplus]